jgi:ankyrin repeat protein
VKKTWSVDEPDKDGRTPLMHAAIDARTDTMRVLLDSGASPGIQDKGGWTALHFAAQAQSAEAIELLVSHGATVDVADGYGNTPLARAVSNYRGNGDAVITLLRLGADKHRENNHGNSPASLANRIANYDVKKFF